MIVSIVAVCGALFLVGQTASVAIQTHSVLPLEDEWNNLLVFKAMLQGRNGLEALLSQHNEHRIAFPRLVLFADYLLFHGSGWLDLGVILTFQALHAALLSGLLLSIRPRSPGTIALAAMPFLLLFSLRQAENFVWSFQVTFISVFMLSSLAIAVFSAATDASRSEMPTSRSYAVAGGAFILAAGAGVSMTNGLIAAVVLVIVALTARSHRLALLAPAFAILLIGAFAIGYSPGEGHESVAGWIRNPGRLLMYTASYLGNFIDDDLRLSTALGTLGLLATLAVGIVFVIRAEQHPARLALFGIMLFTAGSAFLTALGRSVDGIEGAMSDRYATGSATFWSALLGLGWSLSGRLTQPIGIRLPVMAISLVLIVAVVRAQPSGRAAMRDVASKQAAFQDGLVQGYIDKDLVVALQDIPESIPAGLDFLKQRRISLFDTEEADMLGKPLPGASEAQSCAGTVEAAVPAPDVGTEAVRVSGVGAGPRTSDMRRIVLADPAGKVVGFASTRFGAAEWTGYATAARGAVLTAFARLGRGQWCHIAQHTVSDPDPAPAL